MPAKRIGSSASIINAVLNSIVNRDETGDGIVELAETGDLMKLESGDLIGVEVSEDGSRKPEGDAISPTQPQIH